MGVSGYGVPSERSLGLALSEMGSPQGSSAEEFVMWLTC